jgi:hypothetical protein
MRNDGTIARIMSDFLNDPKAGIPRNNDSKTLHLHLAFGIFPRSRITEHEIYPGVYFDRLCL